MAVSELILGGQIFRISKRSLMDKCELFIEGSSLLMRPYEVQSSVSRDNFQVFIDAINGGNITITDQNVSDLELLCKEFKFGDLFGQVEKWFSVNSSIDWKARREVMNQKGRIDDLEQQLREQRKELLAMFEANDERATTQKKETEALRVALTSLKELTERQEDHKLLDGKIVRHENEINQMLDEVKQVPGMVQENLSNFQKELAKLKERMEKWEQGQRFNSDKQPLPPSTTKLPTLLVPLTSSPSFTRTTPARKDSFDSNSSTKPKNSSDEQLQTLPKPVRVTPPLQGKQFIPSDALFEANDRKPKNDREKAPRVPLNGIIMHLTKECGGNVHDRKVVTVTSSEPLDEYGLAKNAAHLEELSCFVSAHHEKKEDIPHTRNNWICYDFGKRRIIPTHYTIRTHMNGVNAAHLKNWFVETSPDGQKWTEIDRKENNSEMNANSVTRTFAVSGATGCRFIRLVNVGRNWRGDDMLAISAWEVFGTILED